MLTWIGLVSSGRASLLVNGVSVGALSQSGIPEDVSVVSGDGVPTHPRGSITVGVTPGDVES